MLPFYLRRNTCHNDEYNGNRQGIREYGAQK